MQKHRHTAVLVIFGYIWAMAWVLGALVVFAVFPPIWFVSGAMALIGLWPLHRALMIALPGKPIKSRATVEVTMTSLDNPIDDPYMEEEE